jgi:hypothetical protein
MNFFPQIQANFMNISHNLIYFSSIIYYLLQSTYLEDPSSPLFCNNNAFHNLLQLIFTFILLFIHKKPLSPEWQGLKKNESFFCGIGDYLAITKGSVCMKLSETIL